MIVPHPTRQLHTTKESTLHPIRSFGHGDQAGSASIATAIDLSFPPFPINCLSSARKWTTTPIDAPKTMANTLCSVFRRWRLHYGRRDWVEWSLSNRSMKLALKWRLVRILGIPKWRESPEVLRAISKLSNKNQFRKYSRSLYTNELRLLPVPRPTVCVEGHFSQQL